MDSSVISDYRSMARDIAQRYSIPTGLFDALISSESSWNPWAFGAAGEIGLGQLMPGTARDLGVDPWNPEENLTGAARYLKQQLDSFGNVRDALAAYKAGPGNLAAGYLAADKTLKMVGSAGTKSNAKKILGLSALGPAGIFGAAAEASGAAAMFSWANPDTWLTWLRSRGFDVLVGLLGVVFLLIGIWALANAASGGALKQGFNFGAREALRGAL